MPMLLVLFLRAHLQSFAHLVEQCMTRGHWHQEQKTKDQTFPLPRVVQKLLFTAMPHAWFWHFYAFAMPLSAAALAISNSSCIKRSGSADLILSLLEMLRSPAALLTLQVSRRFFEARKFAKLRPHSRMYSFVYTNGFVFYLLAVLSVFAASVNGAKAGGLALMLFITGSLWQTTLHHELMRCAYVAGPSPEQAATPSGWSFAHADRPHFGAEVVIYAGIAMCWPLQLPLLGIFLITLFNLIIAARAAQTRNSTKQKKTLLLPYIL